MVAEQSLTHDSDERHAPLPPGVGDCPHRVRVVGYVRSGSHTRTDCLQPLRAVCELGCGYETFWRCDCSSDIRCPPCAERQRLLLARIVDHGITDRLGVGYTYFVTLTAPGENAHLRLFQGKRPAHRPECTCHYGLITLGKAEWNAQESACWNRLNTALRRIDRAMTFIGAVETQKRGLLHRHLVINTAGPLVHEDVQRLALTAGYGCSVDIEPLQSASKAARYISKYVTKSSGARGDVPWMGDVVDKDTGEVRRLHTTPTFRTWSAAQSWGFTKKGLREIAKLQAQARARYLLELAELLDQEKAGSLALQTAGDVHMSGPPG